MFACATSRVCKRKSTRARILQFVVLKTVLLAVHAHDTGDGGAHHAYHHEREQHLLGHIENQQELLDQQQDLLDIYRQKAEKHGWVPHPDLHELTPAPSHSPTLSPTAQPTEESNWALEATNAQIMECIDADVQSDRCQQFLEGDFAGTGNSLIEEGKDFIGDIRDKGAEFVEDVFEQGEEFVDDVFEQGEEFVDDVVNNAKEFTEDAIENLQNDVAERTPDWVYAIIGVGGVLLPVIAGYCWKARTAKQKREILDQRIELNKINIEAGRLRLAAKKKKMEEEMGNEANYRIANKRSKKERSNRGKDKYHARSRPSEWDRSSQSATSSRRVSSDDGDEKDEELGNDEYDLDNEDIEEGGSDRGSDTSDASSNSDGDAEEDGEPQGPVCTIQ